MLPRPTCAALTGWLPMLLLMLLPMFLLMLLSLSTLASAAPASPNRKTVTTTGMVINQQLHQQIQQNAARLAQLEQANQNALARNQELQLINDNLTVQVQVLQSERSAQMFLYGAATLAVGAFIGFLLANYISSKRTRRW